MSLVRVHDFSVSLDGVAEAFAGAWGPGIGVEVMGRVHLILTRPTHR